MSDLLTITEYSRLLERYQTAEAIIRVGDGIRERQQLRRTSRGRRVVGDMDAKSITNYLGLLMDRFHALDGEPKKPVTDEVRVEFPSWVLDEDEEL